MDKESEASTSEVNKTLDASSLFVADDDIPEEFVKFREQLKLVEALVESYNVKMVDRVLCADDLDVLKRELKYLSEFEQELTDEKMKCDYVPYKTRALQMVQESYRICNWLIQKKFSEMDNTFEIDSFFDKIYEACAGKENPFEHINTMFDGVLKNDNNFNLNFFGNIKSNSTYEIASKQGRKEYKKSEKRPLEDQVVPIEVENEMGDNELQRTITNVKNCLIRAVSNNNGEPVPFFKFAIDPFSFSHSVENLFHLAVLVKDRLIKIALNEGCKGDEHFATVTVVKKNHNENDEIEKDDFMTTILSINHDLWKHYIEKYNITEQMITPIE